AVPAAAPVEATLLDARADRVVAVGTSARAGHTVGPLLDARDAGQEAVTRAQPGQKVALVFGRERSGLTNEELDHCRIHLCIPTNPDYASLNLAAAVQVVGYELRMAAGAGMPVVPTEQPVAVADLEG